MADRNLTGFGVEHKQIAYKDYWSWFVQINDVENLWKAQPTYIISQIVFLLGGLFTLVHSLRKGGRWPWLWLATVLHGIVVEIITYNLPDIDNFWHSQTPVIFLGGRLPLHIILLYPFFIYNAAYAVSRFQLPSWAEPFATGLMVVLIDLPYDVLCVKFIHWTWHDTDPNIGDRFYWVPWNSFYFHSTFAASFIFWFHFTFNFFKGSTTDKWQSRGFFKELRTTVMAALLGMPGGVLMFIPLYHPLHDLFRIHSEVTYFMLFTIFIVIAWCGDRTLRERVQNRVSAFDWLLFLHLMCHYSLYLSMTIFGNPEKEVSMGYHEQVGSCSQTVAQRTITGLTLKRRKYLCPIDYHEDYFTFSCLPGGRKPINGAIWYTICGTPFRNRYEYIAVIGTVCFLAVTIFYNSYFRFTTNAKDTRKNKSKMS